MSKLQRDWMLAIAKTRGEVGCRICGRQPVDAAHVIGRARDKRIGNKATVDPDSVIPLCREHHMEYDAHRLDVLPYLTVAEEVAAVRDAGGIVAALRRVSGRQAGEMAA